MGTAGQGQIASRLLEFVFALLRHHGVDPRALGADLPSFGNGAELPAWVSWDDYLAMIDRLAVVVGGPAGIARGMRATLDTAYSDLRALAGFFSGPVPFFSFVTHHLMRELSPTVHGTVDVVSQQEIRVRYEILEPYTPSLMYSYGTVTLTELFPTHFGLPEAQVEVVSRTARACDLLVRMPDVTVAAKVKLSWGEYLPTPTPTPTPRPSPEPQTRSLTPREQEVLRFVCAGLTNAEIATALGTSPSTVKTQISSILGKMDVANRTELASRMSRSLGES